MRSNIAAAVLVLGALAAGGAAVVITWDKRRMAAELRAAFERHGLPGAWGEALGRKESDLDLRAVNLTGPDGARGGSYGPTQISAQTARAWGYSGSMERLRTDGAFAAELTAQMVAAGFAERAGNVYSYGPPASLEELGAVWNAGRAWTDPKLPASTRTKYVPKLRAALAASESGVA